MKRRVRKLSKKLKQMMAANEQPLRKQGQCPDCGGNCDQILSSLKQALGR